MAESQLMELVQAGLEMDEVGNLISVINHVCDADVLPATGALRDALSTLARIAHAKLDRAREVIEAAGEAHG